MSDSVRIGGRAHSWNHIIFKCDDDRYHRITQIDFGDKLEREMGYGLGTHQAPVAMSAGKYSADQLKLTMYEDTYDLMTDYLAAQSPTGDCVTTHLCTFSVQIATPGLRLQNIVLERCGFSSVAEKYALGTAILMKEVAFDVMLVRRNGKVLFDSSGGAP